MYAMICTRPNIALAFSMCSKYQENAREVHWTATKAILKYIRKTNNTFLVYGGNTTLVIDGYTNASFQIDKDDYRSQSNFITNLYGKVQSKAQSQLQKKQSTQLCDSKTLNF